jgi:hypothetical protein
MRKSLSVQYPGSSIQTLSYSYDTADRLINIQSSTPPSIQSSYSYQYKPNWDVVSAVSATAGANTFSQGYTYDDLGRRIDTSAQSAFNGQPAATIFTRSYAYNPAGQRISQSIQSSILPPFQSSISYAYDSLGQLTSANKFKGNTQQMDYNYAYQYDLIGNRLAETRNTFQMSFSHNSLNQTTTRNWTGGLTVSGRATPGADVQSVNVNILPAFSLDSEGNYVVQCWCGESDIA